MERSELSWEQRTVVNELIQGMEVAKQLSCHLKGASAVEVADSLVQRILSSYEKALLILNWKNNGSSSSSSMEQTLQAVVTGTTTAAVAAAGSAGIPGSPLSRNGSPRSEEFDGSKDSYQVPIDASKKRKAMPRWTDQVRMSSENGLEGPIDDGFSWRKYGQKDILGAKYPRSYYRCTYRSNQNCWAIKQVQRSDEDPTIFEVTYRGTHTCSYGQQTVASPEKEEQQKHNISRHQHPLPPPPPPPKEALQNLQKNLKVDTQDLDNRETIPFTFPSTYYECQNSNYSPSFLSPATPEPNYYHQLSPLMSSFGGGQSLQLSDSELAEIISAQTSATSSPILDLDFSLESFDLVPNLLYPPGFFT
ncbi:Probable WRKY transcription factor 41 [Linum grandiflorum]